MLLRVVRFVYCDFCDFAVGVRVGCVSWYCCFVLPFSCSFVFVWLVSVGWGWVLISSVLVGFRVGWLYLFRCCFALG